MTAPSRTVNTRLAITLLVLTPIAAAGMHWLHGYQVKQSASVLLRLAEQAEQADDLPRAIRILDQYLKFEPNDLESLAKYGEWYDRAVPVGSDRTKVLLAYERVLRADPSNDAIKRRMAELAYEVGRFPDAIEHLMSLKDRHPNDAKLTRLLADCKIATGKYTEAATHFEESLKQDPSDMETYIKYATLLRRHLNDSDQADRLMEAMVSSNAQLAKAYLIRASYWSTFERELDKAIADMEQARALAPSDPEVLLTAAELSVASANRLAGGNAEADVDAMLARAEADLTKGLADHAGDLRFYKALSGVQQRRGGAAAAIETLKRGLEIAPKDFDLRWTLADLLISLRDLNAAREQVVLLRQRTGPANAMVEYLEARMLAMQSQWYEASRTLQGIIPYLVGTELVADAYELLGACHGALGNPDQQRDAYRAVLVNDPLRVTARQGLAEALLALGRLDEAINEYRTMLTLPEAPAFGWTADVGWSVIGRLLVVRTLRQPEGNQDWSSVQAAVDEIRKTTPDSIEAVLLQAELHAGKGEAALAEALLKKSIVDNPKNEQVRISLANLLARTKRYQDAVDVLATAEREIGENVDLLLARARLIAVESPLTAAPELQQIEARHTAFPRAEATLLIRGLAELQFALGNAKDAERLWHEVAVRQPRNLFARLVLFDLALADKDLQEQQRQISAIQSIEGEKGVYAKATAATMIIHQCYHTRDRSRLPEARSLLTEAAALRPSWFRIPLAQGELEDLDQNLQRALEHYKTSLALGNRNPSTVQRAVELLYQQRRYGDADRLVREFEENVRIPLSPVLNRLAAEVSLQMANAPRAADLARRAVIADSDDFRDHLWLARIQQANGDPAAAEKHVRRALELDPKVAESWIALMRLQGDDAARQDAVLEEIRRTQPPDDSPRILGLSLAAVGRFDEAERELLRAVEKSPRDVELLRDLAQLYTLRSKTADAEKYWRKVLNPQLKAQDDLRAVARRGLAVALMTSGDYRHHREALALVKENLDSLDASDDDRRLKAGLLALRGNRTERLEAVALLRSLSVRSGLKIEDIATLANLYEGLGDLPRAKEYTAELIAQEPNRLEYLVRHASILLDMNDVDAARLWLAKIAELDVYGLSTLELQSRIAVFEERDDEAVQMLRDFALKPGGSGASGAEAARMLEAAVRLEAHGRELARSTRPERGDPFLDAAHELFRKVAEADPSKQYLYGAFLGRQHQVEEAIEIFESSLPAAPLRAVVNACMATLRANRLNAEQLKRTTAIVEEAAKKHPLTQGYEIDLGFLYEQQERWADAENAYQKVYKEYPENVLVLNNLAWLHLLRNRQGEEPLKLINQAIEITGPLHQLLDTRAMAYFVMKRYDDALADLQTSMAESSDNVKLFHLALVQFERGFTLEARQSFLQARSQGLAAEDLHPLEREWFKLLSERFDSARRRGT